MLSASTESPRMFKSNFMDFFSRTPWWSIPLVWGPVVIGLFAYSLMVAEVPWTFAVPQAIAGAVFWTFSEYWLHRTLFHWQPDHALGKRFHFIIHGVHHEWVDDPYRLVMPPVAGIAIASFFWAAFSAATVALTPWFTPGWMYALFAGFLGGYINYDLTHYAQHHMKLTGKRRIRLRAHHMNHHFNNHDRKFGISTMFWDRIFRTM